MSLLVREPGLHSLVVDLGRPRCRSLGMPVGGAADRAALAIGNALVGNSQDAPALEFTLVGPTLVAECDLGCALAGSEFAAETDRQRPRVGNAFNLQAGEVLRLGPSRGGARGYLCVRGGFELPEILGSRSALEPVKRGERLKCAASHVPARFVRLRKWQANRVITLHALAGAQADWFASDAVFGRRFRVGEHADRMGVRLEGTSVVVPNRELVSEPVCPGSVQVTPDGGCVILGVDGQTIGGYPKIAQVAAADLDAVGQLRPGDDVRFERIELDEAERMYRRRERWLSEWVTRLSVTCESLTMPSACPEAVRGVKVGG